MAQTGFSGPTDGLRGTLCKSIAPDLLEFIPLKIMDSRMLAQALLNNSWIDDNVGGLSILAIALMLLLACVADLVQLVPGMPDHFCRAWELEPASRSFWLTA